MKAVLSGFFSWLFQLDRKQMMSWKDIFMATMMLFIGMLTLLMVIVQTYQIFADLKKFRIL